MNNGLSFLLLSFILCCFFCHSCKGNKEKQISYVLERDTIDAPDFYVTGFYEDGSGIYLYGLKRDTIYLYKENIDRHFEYDSYIRIPQQYTDNEHLYKIEQLVFINMDSIIIYHQNHLALISIQQDSVLKKFYHSRDSDWYCFISRGCTFLRWNKKRNTLPISIYRYDNTETRTWRGDTEFMGEYSFEKDTFSFFPVKLPYYPYNYPLLTDYHGGWTDELFAFNGDTFFVGFQITPTTYLYNAANNHIDSLYLKNSMYIPVPEADTARISEVSYDNYMHEAFLKYNFYHAIVYDEYNEVYYRFFSKAMPRRNAEGLLNTMEDKEFGLTVLDENLRIIGDVCWSWDDYRFITHYPTSKGLYGYCPPYAYGKTVIFKKKLIYEK